MHHGIIRIPTGDLGERVIDEDQARIPAVDIGLIPGTKDRHIAAIG